MFNEVKEIYSASIYFPKTDGEIEFKYSSMEVKKCYPYTLETKYSYFISRNNSTSYFEEDMLDREYKITNELTVLYSADKSKCIDWLIEKRSSLLQSYKHDYERIEKSEIKETFEAI